VTLLAGSYPGWSCNSFSHGHDHLNQTLLFVYGQFPVSFVNCTSDWSCENLWLQGDADSALDRLWAKKKVELGQ
jgi:hypothetical protein